MRIENKDMPKVKLFTDVWSNWNNTEYIASFLAVWKDEACLMATSKCGSNSLPQTWWCRSFFFPKAGLRCSLVSRVEWQSRLSCYNEGGSTWHSPETIRQGFEYVKNIQF
jgi:hypothetical protein